MGRLSGKVAVVTGAGSGMGAAEAKLFAQEGALVVLTDVQPEPIARAAEELVADGLAAMSLTLDVTSEEQWAAAVQTVVARFGRIDVLVNNAGIAGRPVQWKDATYDEFQHIMNVNLNSQYLGIQAVRPHMEAAGGGSIINIASVASHIAFPNTQPAYTASKGASRLLTKSAAVDLAASNIRVNSIHPGLIDTPMNDYITRDPDVLAGALGLIPLGRMAQPIEIARVALFLASDDSSYMTASELIVDGGLISV